jgi:cell wall-associated NlpC family hydrolase
MVGRRSLRAVVHVGLLAAVVGLLPGSAASAVVPKDPYLAATVPVADGCIVLDRAWAGVKVFLVQRRLGVSGSLDRYDDATAAAVKALQRRHGLKVTGRVNRPTWRATDLRRPFCMDRFTVQPGVGIDASRAERVDAMVRWARAQVGVRYVWGGAGPIGYDCSGLALQGMYAGGLVLPTVTTDLHQRQDFGTATAIYESGLKRVRLADRQRGDLVFWGPPGSMSHMAVYLGEDRILEAVRPRARYASLWSHSPLPLTPYVVRPFTVR